MNPLARLCIFSMNGSLLSSFLALFYGIYDISYLRNLAKCVCSIGVAVLKLLFISCITILPQDLKQV